MYLIFILVMMRSILLYNIKRKKEVAHMIKLFSTFIYVTRVKISYAVIFGSLYPDALVFAQIFTRVYAQIFTQVYAQVFMLKNMLKYLLKNIYSNICSRICSNICSSYNTFMWQKTSCCFCWKMWTLYMLLFVHQQDKARLKMLNCCYDILKKGYFTGSYSTSKI